MSSASTAPAVETPPNIGGEREVVFLPLEDRGTTPTHMGRTRPALDPVPCTGKHPHAYEESVSGGWKVLAVGNAPTPVGRTMRTYRRHPIPWKHPHPRGEH